MRHPYTSQVRAYYERNTRIFRAFGRDSRTNTIHRAVWAPGVRTADEALHYINGLALAAAEALRPAGPIRAIDLGCGVGGTLLYLAERFGERFTGVGVTISPAQVRLARANARARGAAARCAFLEASYLALPLARQFDLAIAVESLVHAPDRRQALAEAARALRPGGRLLICDDFVAEGAGAGEAWLVEAFRRGWHAPAAGSVAETLALAGEAGLRLVARRDLTPDLRLLRLPGALVRATLAGGRALPATWALTQSLVGGLALQDGLRRGVFGYHWLELERLPGYGER